MVTKFLKDVEHNLLSESYKRLVKIYKYYIYINVICK